MDPASQKPVANEFYFPSGDRVVYACVYSPPESSFDHCKGISWSIEGYQSFEGNVTHLLFRRLHDRVPSTGGRSVIVAHHEAHFPVGNSPAGEHAHQGNDSMFDRRSQHERLYATRCCSHSEQAMVIDKI